MEIVALIGRVLFSVLFIMAGIGHFTGVNAMTEYGKAKGLPAARLGVLASGVVLVVGGLSVLLGVWGDLGSLLLFLFLVPAAVVFHDFWKQSDPTAKQTEQVMFSKNIALAGASLILFTAFANSAIGLTLTPGLF